MSETTATATASLASPIAARASITPARFLLIVWAAFSLGKIALAGPAIAAGEFGDTDDYMRLAEWRDFLGGQGWFDLAQHRFVGPDGGDMHFSRLPDALMSVFFWLTAPLLGPAAAERFTLLVYPPLLLLVFLSAIAVAAHRLAGRQGVIAAIALAMIASPVMQQFAPGRIDHHGLALALSMVSLAAILVSYERAMAAILAAIAGVAAAAVSLETAPLAAAAGPAVALVFLATGKTGSLRAFGATLLIAAPAALVATLGGAGFADLHCDAYAAPAAAAMTGAGLLALALSFVPARTAALRFAAACAGAAILAGALVLSFPQCLGGPFEGMDPLAREVWLAAVSEAKSPAELLRHRPGALIGFYVFPAVALVAGACSLLAARGAERQRQAAALIFAGAAALMLLVAVRGAILAAAFAVLPLSVFLAQAMKSVVWSPPQGVAKFLALCLVASPLSWFAVGDTVNRMNGGDPAAARAASTAPCWNVNAARALGALPPSILFTEIDLGPMLLAHTDHSVTAAPYHRNGRSMRRTIEFYTGSEQAARETLARSGADFVVFCPALGETGVYAARAPDGLAARLRRGETPDWLVPVDAAGAAPLRLYRLKSP